MNEDFSKLPPHDLDAEQALIGSIILDPTILDQMGTTVAPESFFLADYEIIYRTVSDLWKHRREGIDAVTIRAELIKRGQLDEVGGTTALAQAMQSVPTATNWHHYAEIVRDRATLRSIIKIANVAQRACYGAAQGDSGQLAQKLLGQVSDLVKSATKGDIVKIESVILDVISAMESPESPVMATGFADIDAIIGGVAMGEQVIIGARPSMGKSTFCRQLALKLAMAGVPVGFIALEENAAKIGRNLISSIAEVDNHKIRKPDAITGDERNRVYDSANKFNNMPLWINDRVRRLDDIRAQAGVMKARHQVKVIIIDHLAKVRAPGNTDYERVSNASAGISDLIKDLDVIGYVACQLNRALNSREDKRPGMSDLRGSGEIEQNADQVWFLHREDYYHITEPDYQATRELEVIIAKNRDGKRGDTVFMRSELHFQRFQPMPQRRREYETPF